MKIALATVQVPFVQGGAELMSQGLKNAIRSHGHDVEVISIPFRFSPPQEVQANMDVWLSQDFNTLSSIDCVIALKFPAYYLKHHNKKVWLMHQHRSVYELFDTKFGESSKSNEAVTLKEQIHKEDSKQLNKCNSVFTISQTVTDRLFNNNHVKSKALYQPPPSADFLKPGNFFPYIFCPSRLESLKRQDVLIRAMAYVDEPIYAIIAGTGGRYNDYIELAHSLNVDKRILFTGHTDRLQMLDYYSNAFAVYFGPYDEDYGFITLEAMLSAKPVITFKDSGGPTEFVNHNETGLILDAEPELLATEINRLWSNKNKTRDMGQAGLQRYSDMNISWNNVVETLVGEGQ